MSKLLVLPKFIRSHFDAYTEIRCTENQNTRHFFFCFKYNFQSYYYNDGTVYGDE